MLVRYFFSGFSNNLISFNKSWKCSISLPFIKTLNVASSTFRSVVLISLAKFFCTICISANVSSPFNVFISKDSKFSKTTNDGWSKHQWLGKIAVCSDRTGLQSDDLPICFHIHQNCTAKNI